MYIDTYLGKPWLDEILNRLVAVDFILYLKNHQLSWAISSVGSMFQPRAWRISQRVFATLRIDVDLS